MKDNVIMYPAVSNFTAGFFCESVKVLTNMISLKWRQTWATQMN